MRKAFATPHVIDVGGAPVIISIGSKATYGYDPMTGKELWRVEERSAHSGSTRPVVGHGLVFIPTGFPKGTLLAIRPNGRGNVTATHVAWRLERGIPNKPSLAAGRRPAVHGRRRRRRAGASTRRRATSSGRRASAARSRRRRSCRATASTSSARKARRRSSRPAGVQGAGREPARRRLHGLAGGGGRRAFLRSRTHLYRIGG